MPAGSPLFSPGDGRTGHDGVDVVVDTFVLSLQQLREPLMSASETAVPPHWPTAQLSAVCVALQQLHRHVPSTSCEIEGRGPVGVAKLKRHHVEEIIQRRLEVRCTCGDAASATIDCVEVRKE